MNNYLSLGLLAFGCGFITVLMLTPLLIKRLKRIKLLAVPNQRSSHIHPTPSSGGIVFFPLLLVLSAIFLLEDVTVSVLILFITFSGILGWIDDVRDISPKIKLAVQLLISFGLFSSGVSLQQVFIHIGITIHYPVIDFIATTLLIVSFMNAFNLIDGIDGLAGGVAFLSAMVFVSIFYQLRDWPFFVLSMGIASAILAFLIYNFQPAKVFMGDTGSLLLGCFLVVCFFRSSSESTTYLLLAISTMIYPFLDMLRLFVGRILLHRTPFGADQNHYHHLLLVNGFNHRKSSLTIYFIHLLIMISSIVFSHYFPFIPSVLLLSAFALTSFIFIQFLFAKTLLARRSLVAKHIQEYSETNHLIKKHLS